MLAVGSHNGQVVIWDFITRGEATIIQPHVACVRSVWYICSSLITDLFNSFGKTGRTILSASDDKTVKVTDILTNAVTFEAQIGAAALFAQFHPQNPYAASSNIV